jgi:hypothetical protein
MSDLQVVHASAGRLRLRIPRAVAADDLPAALPRETGVVGCRWSPRTRSLLILYRAEATDAEALTDTVARLTGTRRADAPQGFVAADRPTGTPGVALTTGLRDAVGMVDGRVQRATRGLVGLGGLLPLALIGWAAVELARGRGGPLAWSTALWYAHGLFRDYALPPRD